MEIKKGSVVLADEMDIQGVLGFFSYKVEKIKQINGVHFIKLEKIKAYFRKEDFKIKGEQK